MMSRDFRAFIEGIAMPGVGYPCGLSTVIGEDTYS